MPMLPSASSNQNRPCHQHLRVRPHLRTKLTCEQPQNLDIVVLQGLSLHFTPSRAVKSLPCLPCFCFSSLMDKVQLRTYAYLPPRTQRTQSSLHSLRQELLDRVSSILRLRRFAPNAAHEQERTNNKHDDTHHRPKRLAAHKAAQQYADALEEPNPAHQHH